MSFDVDGLVRTPGSWLDGSGQLAWTMFSRTGSFRFRIVAVDQEGHRRTIAPTLLASRASALPRGRLAGSDRWRFHEVTRATVRRHLHDFAKLACEVTKARRVEVALFDRVDLDAPVRTRTAARRCE